MDRFEYWMKNMSIDDMDPMIRDEFRTLLSTRDDKSISLIEQIAALASLSKIKTNFIKQSANPGESLLSSIRDTNCWDILTILEKNNQIQLASEFRQFGMKMVFYTSRQYHPPPPSISNLPVTLPESKTNNPPKTILPHPSVAAQATSLTVCIVCEGSNAAILAIPCMHKNICYACMLALTAATRASTGLLLCPTCMQSVTEFKSTFE